MEGDPYEIDLKLKESFKPEDFGELMRFFKSHDKDKNGTIDNKELLEMLHDLGYRDFKQPDADKLFVGIDRNNDKKVSFKEFCTAMKKFKDTNGQETVIQTIVNKAGKSIKRVSKSNESYTFQSFSEEEKTAYCKVINSALADDPICKKYLPINPESEDLFPRLKDGVLLCKLINLAQEGTIDDRVINTKSNMNVFHMVENLNLAISAAKSLGYSCVGINYDIFINGKNNVLELGLLWQIVKNVVLCKINLKQFPELVRLLKDGEQLADLLKLSPEQLLLRWFNYHLKNAGYPKEITNFSSDIKDSEKYTILLNQLNKEQCDKSALDESDLKKRAEKVIANSKKLGAETYINPDDICKGNTKLNTLFVAAIFNACPGLEPATEKEKMDAAGLLEDDAEGAREERAFRMWMNSLNLPGEDGEPISVNNLYEESKSGVLLLKAIDKVKPGSVDWKKVDKKPKNPFKMQANCVEVINACKKNKFSIVGIGGPDIREGNKKYILAVVWQLMRAHSLQVIGNKTEEDLVAWGNDKVGEDKLKIKSLKDKSLSNSLFFIYIMKTIEPRSINWDLVIQDKDDEEAKEKNAKYAISIARKLGATVFLVWEDIKECKSRLLLTFLASIYDVAQKYKAAC